MSIPNKFDKLGNIIVQSEQPLTLTAKSTNCKVKITTEGSPTVSGLKYRTSNKDNWQKYTINKEITLANINDYVQFKNDNNYLSTSTSNYVQFVMEGNNIEASGNIMSMLNYSTSCTDFCFHMLFYGCTSLTTIKNLHFPAVELAQFCYYMMFKGCTSLRKTCDLPATTIPTAAKQCYRQMFTSCINLNEVTCRLTSWPASTYTDNWLYDVSDSGIFICPRALGTIRDASHIPANWNKSDI